MDYNFGLIYLGFFTLIGVSIWITQNPWCLLALVLAPSYHSSDDKKEEE